MWKVPNTTKLQGVGPGTYGPPPAYATEFDANDLTTGWYFKFDPIRKNTFECTAVDTSKCQHSFFRLLISIMQIVVLGIGQSSAPVDQTLPAQSRDPTRQRSLTDVDRLSREMLDWSHRSLLDRCWHQNIRSRPSLSEVHLTWYRFWHRSCHLFRRYTVVFHR